MQNKRRKTKALTLTMTIALIFAVVLSFSAAPQPGLFIAEGTDSVSGLKKKLDELDREQKILEQEMAQVAAEKKTTSIQKDELDRKINIAQDEIDTMQRYIAALDENIVQKEEEIVQKQSDIDVRFEILRMRARATYEAGKVSYLEVVLGASSFSDFLSRVDMVSSVLNHDRDLIETLGKEKSAVEAAKAELESNRSDRISTLNNLQQRQASLKTQMQQVDALIEDLVENQEELAAAYAAAEREQKKVNAEIDRIIASQAKTVYVGGDFTWPLPSSYSKINSYFGMRLHPVLKVEKMHTGIDLPAPRGTNIYAANAGTVILNAYNKGYGNYIVVDHGGGKSTLYAHMSKTSPIGVGKKVSKGDVIGSVGSTGYSTGNHLHFEIRENGSAVDPMKYFKKG
jgi:murein DD-endopeptidase MepM/ murein hydrolase activator NlpD